MIGAESIIKCLEKENVDMVFGYPGGAVLPLYEALRTSEIKHILVRHENAAALSANGYARAKGSVGVCIATSGPGATNLITGIATAYMDSIPLVIITGQVSTSNIGKDVFQEVDITGATEPFTKHNYLIKNVHDIPRVIKEAFHIANTGRKGPVLVDIPVDIQNTQTKFTYPDTVNIPGYKPVVEGNFMQVKRALKQIKQSQKPLILAGGGILSSKAEVELKSFAEQFKIPVVHTLMGLGSIPSNSPCYVGMIGSHGSKYCKDIVNTSDLLIIIGCRIGNRSKANYNLKNKKTIHIDIDPAEIGKTLDINTPVVGDAKNILQQLLKTPFEADTCDWFKQINTLKEDCVQQEFTTNNYINPKIAIKTISNLVDEDTILTADVGQNQMWAARNYEIKGNRQFFTSGGLGTMGYSIPASIGAKLASSNKRVISIVGDGSIQMQLGELGTLSEHTKNNIIILFNNSRLGMVRELQYNAYGKENYFGIDFCMNPDFLKIAEGYGLWSKRACTNEEFEEIFKEALSLNKPCLIECIVDKDFHTL